MKFLAYEQGQFLGIVEAEIKWVTQTWEGNLPQIDNLLREPTQEELAERERRKALFAVVNKS